MKPRIVLVHGIFNSGYVFYAMRKRLEAKGIECFTPSLKPRDGRHGIEDLALKLKREIDHRYGSDDPINLLGFSMGGIVARYYLQKLAGHERVTRFFTVSAPHHGSYLAYCYPGQGARDLRPNSWLLRSLMADEDRYRHLQLYSFWTPFDLMIIPPSSSVWAVADNKQFYSPLHLLMLFNRSLVGFVGNCILDQE
ncbi:esterase/lipase family protein [Methylomarinum vadi]|uniref:esterase/lipase family protein n=1 Tax=Methylomarinum vadi TaxID=438855 RepID=UPI00055DBAFB|nr:alpha/beta fold hydrolase [Methylomarinum vadi]